MNLLKAIPLLPLVLIVIGCSLGNEGEEPIKDGEVGAFVFTTFNPQSEYLEYGFNRLAGGDTTEDLLTIRSDLINNRVEAIRVDSIFHSTKIPIIFSKSGDCWYFYQLRDAGIDCVEGEYKRR
jgi:hypothetical protein